MDDEIHEVKTCLDQIVTQPEVSNKDLARAMQSFVSHCYIKHVQITTGNSRKVDNLTEMMAPIAEWVRPKIERELQWRQEKRKILLHVACWAIPVVLIWAIAIFGVGLRELLIGLLKGA